MRQIQKKQGVQPRHSGRKCFNKMIAFALAAVMLFGSTLSIQAAAANKKTYTVKDVFDAEYYANTYSDVKNAIGTNKNDLYRHYNTVGKAEGRRMSELIDIEKYKAANADLRAVFGDNDDAYVNHYLKSGFQEGRNSFGTFDARAYADRYPDLKTAFGYDVFALYQHYMNFGRGEGRNAAAVRVVPKTSTVNTSSSDSSDSGSSDSGSSDSSSSDSGSDSGDEPIDTNPIVTRGRIVNPETGNPVANATITFTRSEFNTLSEIISTESDVAASGSTADDTTADGTTEDDAADDTISSDTDTDDAAIGDTDTDDATTGDTDTDDTTTEDTDADDTTTGDTATDDGDSDETEEGTDGVYTRQTDEDGYYEVPDFVPGVYSVKVAAENYMTLTLNSFTIRENNSSLPTFELLSSDMSGTNTVSGTVVNATTGSGIADVTVNIRSDWNNKTGDIVSTAVTDESGVYSIDLERGYYTLEFVTEGYVSNFVNVASSNAVRECNCPLNPSSTESEVTDNQYRIVLTWGETPSDLDSHLVGPDDADGGFHVYYADKIYEGSDGVSVTLDVDDVSSYGPETVTVLNIDMNKTYYYSVKDFSNGGNANSKAMSESSAEVKVYNGSELVETYYVPQGQEGYIWNVFKIEKGSLVTVNNYNSDESSMYGEYLSPGLYGGRTIETK